MIKLKESKDLESLDKEKINPLIKIYLSDYLTQMLKNFDTNNISEYGEIIYLENVDEINSYINTSPIFVTRITLFKDSITQDISQSIYKKNNKIIVLFSKPEIIESLTKMQYNI